MAVDYHDYIKTEAWRERAEAAKQRVGHRCQICNRPATRVTLDVHHRTYERLGNERPEDLTVLCRGCHELYEKNRRMPSPPTPPLMPPPPLTPPPSLPVAKQETVSTQPSPQPVAVLNGVVPRRPFAPARISPQRATLLAAEETAELLLLPETDHGFTLAPERAVTHYELTATQEREPTTTPTPNEYHPRRRRQVFMALLAAVALLLVAGLYEIVQLTPNGFRPLVTNTQQPAHSDPSGAPPEGPQPTVAALVNSQPTLTVTQAVAVVEPTPTATVAPTLQPTLPPTATALPSTPTTVPPTTVPPTVAPTPQTLVLRSGLVCSKPCSCAPVVRTITQGMPVTVVQTQLCGSDSWTQIGEAEWLGPGLVEQ